MIGSVGSASHSPMALIISSHFLVVLARFFFSWQQLSFLSVFISLSVFYLFRFFRLSLSAAASVLCRSDCVWTSCVRVVRSLFL